MVDLSDIYGSMIYKIEITITKAKSRERSAIHLLTKFWEIQILLSQKRDSESQAKPL